MSLKGRFFIERISRKTAKVLLDEYHYLHQEGNFRSGINYGLFDTESRELVGVCVFHYVSAKEIVKGCFGINTYKLDGFMELGRLCLNPHKHEKNITSFFLSRSISLLRKTMNVVALLTYADSDFHNGYVYQACNFKYYGLTSPKKDFFILQNDGSYKKLQRGKCRGLVGEWRDKSQKHRYLIVYDKNLKPTWPEQSYPKNQQQSPFNRDSTTKNDLSILPIETSQLTLF